MRKNLHFKSNYIKKQRVRVTDKIKNKDEHHYELSVFKLLTNELG